MAIQLSRIFVSTLVLAIGLTTGVPCFCGADGAHAAEPPEAVPSCCAGFVDESESEPKQSDPHDRCPHCSGGDCSGMTSVPDEAPPFVASTLFELPSESAASPRAPTSASSLAALIAAGIASALPPPPRLEPEPLSRPPSEPIWLRTLVFRC